LIDPSVSVIVPCYNAERHIRRCLDGLTHQMYSSREIVVVDDHSTDGTTRVVRDYPTVKLLESPENRGPARARNRGIEASGGDIVVFLDSDCWVDDPNWLGRHINAHRQGGDTIVGGGIEGVGVGVVARADRYCHWLTNIPRSPARTWSLSTPRKRIRFSRHLVTTNMSLQRSTLLRIGPFDERLATGEDVEFCERALSRGIAMRFESDIVVNHHDRERLGDFLRCFYRAGFDRIPARTRHRSQYHHLLPRGVLSAVLLAIPIGLLAPAQPIRAWWPYERRVALYYPLITLASFAMALGIVRYCVHQSRSKRSPRDAASPASPGP
jgi:glycosyltransferase involved in cell wall biosynthesis